MNKLEALKKFIENNKLHITDPVVVVLLRPYTRDRLHMSRLDKLFCAKFVPVSIKSLYLMYRINRLGIRFSVAKDDELLGIFMTALELQNEVDTIRMRIYEKRLYKHR